MKVFVFQGGLGNQIFEYAFYKKELENNPKLRYLFPVKCHNGFELNRWFNVTLNEASIFDRLLYLFADRLKRYGILSMIADKDLADNADCYFVKGFFQDKRYFKDFNIDFKDIKLSNANKQYLEMIKNSNSVAIHVRRGDYLQPPYNEIYGGICTEEYYKAAIEIIRNNFIDPMFFIFSNDKQWVMDNFNLKNAVFVNCNTGLSSPIDLYLMSHAKGNIIANSSFSFWAAYLNRSTQLVVYPKKWFNSKYNAPNIFPSDWFGI